MLNWLRGIYNVAMIRRAFNYLSTLLMCMAILAGAMWAISYRSPMKWSFTGESVLRTVGSSRGVLVFATDYWGGKPKSLGLAGGKAELARWQDFDNRLRALMRSGIGAQSACYGFAFESGLGADGKIEWHLWASPYWALVAVLAIPAFVRLLLPKRKRQQKAKSQTD